LCKRQKSLATVLFHPSIPFPDPKCSLANSRVLARYAGILFAYSVLCVFLPCLPDHRLFVCTRRAKIVTNCSCKPGSFGAFHRRIRQILQRALAALGFRASKLFCHRPAYPVRDKLTNEISSSIGPGV